MTRQEQDRQRAENVLRRQMGEAFTYLTREERQQLVQRLLRKPLR